MLYLIGLGLNIDLTCKARNLLLKKEISVFLEGYTMPWDYIEVKKKLEEQLEKEVFILPREKVESNYLLELARKDDIALLIGGDVFSATTHFALYKEAIENRIKVEVFHNSSIFSAIAKTGLSLYKFGHTTTISFWYDNYKPTSPIKIIEKNKKNLLHSLVLLDLSKHPMDAKEGMRLIRKMEEKENLRVVDDIIVVSRLGIEGEKITYGVLEDLLKKELGKPPFCFVVPSSPNETEKEFLKLFKV